jgi:DNA polymerase-1
MKRKTLLEFDLSQAEARAVAYYCGDSGLKAGFQAGIDCHTQRAAEMFNHKYDNLLDRITNNDKEAKLLRQLAKVCVHATNYDVSARTMNITLKSSGVYKKESEVKIIMASIHLAFPGIKIYQSGVQQALRKTRTLKTAKGMSRYFFSKLDDNTFRRAYAFLPQCTVAEITNDAIVIAEPQLLELDSFILAQVHDSILVEVPEKHVQTAYDICKKALHQPLEIYPFFGQSDVLVIPSDAKVGTHWGELKPWVD